MGAIIKAKVKIVDKDKGFKRVRHELKKLDDSFVTVGIHEGAGNYESGVSIALIANVNEFGATINHPGGTPYGIAPNGQVVFKKKGSDGIIGFTKPHIIKIPERSFVRSTFDKKVRLWRKMMKEFAGDIATDGDTVEQALTRMGIQITDDIRSKIIKLKKPPNAPSTIKAKGSNNPLLDSRLLLRSVNFEVTVKKIGTAP